MALAKAFGIRDGWLLLHGSCRACLSGHGRNVATVRREIAIRRIARQDFAMKIAGPSFDFLLDTCREFA